MSLSPAKDAENGTAVAADEVELARMGYKQELKFVYLSGVVLSANVFPSHRRELSLVQVQIASNLRMRPLFMTHFSELWCFIFHYQHYDRYTFAVPLRFGKFPTCLESPETC